MPPPIWIVLLCIVLACSHGPDAGSVSESSSALSQVPAPGANSAAPGAAVIQRKRIRKATLYLVVDELTHSRGKLEKLVTESQGFVESIESVAQHYAAVASVVMVARIPETRLDAVVAQARKLGRVGQESQESKDVTREIVDTDARLRNMQRTEERLLALLGEQSAALADVLAVERELTRVRGEIEQLSAALKALEHDVAMATLTVHLSNDESADLEGPDDAWKPVRKLWREAGAVVARSAAGLVWSAAALVRMMLMFLPWIPLVGFAWFVWRRVRRK